MQTLRALLMLLMLLMLALAGLQQAGLKLAATRAPALKPA